MPSGVTIAGTLASNGAQQTFLSPVSSTDGTTGLIFAGDATVKDVELDVFSTALFATKGKQTLSNLSMFGNGFSLFLKGTAQTTLKGSTVTVGSQSVGAILQE